MSEEVGREELEEQLKAGEFGEDEPAEEPAGEKEEEQEVNWQQKYQELEQRLSVHEDEVRQKGAAVSEERDRRRYVEAQYAELVERISQARKSQPQQEPEEDLTEEEKFIAGAWEKKYGKGVQVLLQKIQTLEQMLAGTQVQQNQLHNFAYQVEQEKRSNPDFEFAMRHLGDKVRQRANVLYPNDPNTQRWYVEQTFNGAMQMHPKQLYQYIVETEGYVPGGAAPNPQPQTQKPAGSGQRQVKSLGGVAGAAGAMPESFDGKVNRFVKATQTHDELMSLDPKELDKVLKNLRI